MKNDKVYLEQILDSIEKIKDFTKNMTYSDFASDQKTQSAVIMQLALIGELAKRVSLEKKSTIKVPWNEIAGFRNRAIHNYYQIDIEIVWKTVTDDIIFLKDALKVAS